MKTLLSIVIFFLTLNCSKAIGQYTLSDLEALAAEASYEEFFNHALDIRPSERQVSWKSMTLKMADGLGRQILATSEVSEKQFKLIENLYQWPSLKTDDVFKMHRQEIGIKYITKCLKQNPPCSIEVKQFWEQDKSLPDLAFKIYELTRKSEPSPIKTWELLTQALQSPLSEFYCKKDFVQKDVWERLGMEYVRLGSNGDLLKKIDEMLHYDCLKLINQVAQNRLMSPNEVSDRELAFQILNVQGKINSDILDFFYTVYLLEVPSKGDLFNLSWNRLTDLSKHPKRRDLVLEKIKSLDPIPDKILASLDLAKKRAILQHFKFSFPEFLTFYTEKCLSFYAGKESFPNGNPTINCQELMKSDLAIPVIGNKKVDEFNQAIKI